MRFFGSKITRHRTLPFAGGLDADAAAYLTAASITDPTQITAVNNIFKDFKGQGLNNSTYNFYNRLTAFWLFVGGTAAAHKFNAKDPRDVDAAYRLTFSGGWTHSANGSKGNGINTSANTFIAQNVLTQNSNSMAVYFRENNTAVETLFGHQSRPSFTETDISFNGSRQWAGANRFSGGGGTTVHTNINGLIRMDRSSSANYQVYRNGSQIESLTAASEANADTTTFLIGAQRRGDTNGAQSNSDKTICFADIMLANTLSAVEEAAYYTCIQAFQTALSRQV
jgi:hypothetical protein